MNELFLKLKIINALAGIVLKGKSVGDFILGKPVQIFERTLVELCGAGYAFGVASGTDALILSLKALSIGPGDEGIIKKENCRCGLNSKVLQFSGRSSITSTDFIIFKDHGAVSVQYLFWYMANYYANDFKKIQFEQPSDNTLIMRYIPTQFTTKHNIDTLHKFLRSFFNETINVILEEVDTILPNKEGKTSFFIKRT